MTTADDLSGLLDRAKQIRNATRGYNRDYTLYNRLRREIVYATGRDDRRAGIGAQSTNGAYLDGYYADDNNPYHITWDELLRLRRPIRSLRFGRSWR